MVKKGTMVMSNKILSRGTLLAQTSGMKKGILVNILVNIIKYSFIAKYI